MSGKPVAVCAECRGSVTVTAAGVARPHRGRDRKVLLCPGGGKPPKYKQPRRPGNSYRIRACPQCGAGVPIREGAKGTVAVPEHERPGSHERCWMSGLPPARWVAPRPAVPVPYEHAWLHVLTNHPDRVATLSRLLDTETPT